MRDAVKHGEAGLETTARPKQVAAKTRRKRTVAPTDTKHNSVQPDTLEALRFFLGLAQQGHAIAQKNVGDIYYFGRGVEPDYVQAGHWYMMAASQELPAAQIALADLYAYGLGVEQNDAEALRWYRRAADRGDVRAQSYLDDVYGSAANRQLSYAEALRFYKLAADKGDAEALRLLGDRYNFGDGKEKNHRKAVQYYRRAAKLGDVRALFNLGVAYERGRGVEKNDDKAAHWYCLAAKQGYCDAQFNLGVLYERLRVFHLAIHWYGVAAEQGDVRAQHNLGCLYAFGNDKDYRKACYWLSLAASQGDEQAQETLSFLKERLVNVGRPEAKIADKDIEILSEKSYNTTNTLPYFGFDQSYYFKPPMPIHEISELLSSEGVPEDTRSVLVAAVMQLIEDARSSPEGAKARIAALSGLAKIGTTDPTLFAAKIAAAEKVRNVTPTRPFALTHQQQEDVRRRRGEGEALASLAKEFGVSETTVSRVARGVSQAKTRN